MNPENQFAFLPRLESRIDHLYTSLDMLVDIGHYEAALPLVKILFPYWETYEKLGDGIDWLLRFAQPIEMRQIERKSLPEYYWMLGTLLRHQSEYQRAATYYERGLEHSIDAGDHRSLVSMFIGLGEVAFRRGDYDRASSFYRSYLDIGQQEGNDRYIADAVNGLGRLATIKGNFSEALEYHEYGKSLCEKNNYQMGSAWMFNALGELERSRRNDRKAVGYFQESASLFDKLGNRGAYMLALQNLAFANLANNSARSGETFARTLKFWRQGPAKHGMALSIIGLSRFEISRGLIRQAAHRLVSASRLLGQIGARLELGDSLDYEIALDRIRKKLGEAHFQMLFERAEDANLASILEMESEVKTNGRSLGTLTQKETVLLTLIAQGLTDKEVAERLTISPHTVNAHLKSIYRKLSVKNRTAAVAVAKGHGLI
ncbi:MAG: tetratricopeptide repeat protein [Anaerolineales bacterium]|nr:tetratricopeptide repeat protein [Anaerolineales bacterium]